MNDGSYRHVIKIDEGETYYVNLHVIDLFVSTFFFKPCCIKISSGTTLIHIPDIPTYEQNRYDGRYRHKSWSLGIFNGKQQNNQSSNC